MVPYAIALTNIAVGLRRLQRDLQINLSDMALQGGLVVRGSRAPSHDIKGQTVGLILQRVLSKCP